MKDFRQIVVFRGEEIIHSVSMPFEKDLINTLINSLQEEFKQQYPQSEIKVELTNPNFFGW